MPFEREERYVTFKLADVEKYLDSAQLAQLSVINHTIAKGRLAEERKPFAAVVVEKDWPEYEAV